MSRRTVELGLGLRRVSVLDEEGRLDDTLDPRLARHDVRRLLRCMLLVRAYDERRLRLQRQGRIGTFAPVLGQEAAQLGSAYVLRKNDWVVPSFRELAVAIWRGAALVDDLLFCAGRDEGIRIPPEAHDLPIAIPVASQMPHAVGLAWGLKLQRRGEVVCCYFGDGATSEGDFHEALNFASLHQLPIVFFCQNNQWAISVPRAEQTRSRTLAQKAFAYDIPGVIVDGNDLLAVVHATREAVDRARAGRGPTFIEAETYRMGVHTTADDPTLYRPAGDLDVWARRDPLARLQGYAVARGHATPDEIQAWREEAEREVQKAVEDFEAAPAPAPASMFDHVYSTLPPSLARQKRELESRVRARGPQRPPPPPKEPSKDEAEKDESKPESTPQESEPGRRPGPERRPQRRGRTRKAEGERTPRRETSRRRRPS